MEGVQRNLEPKNRDKFTQVGSLDAVPRLAGACGAMAVSGFPCTTVSLLLWHRPSALAASNSAMPAG